MANNIVDKYVKQSQKKTKPTPQKSGSWLSNVMKSIGYSSFDVLTELMPSTADIAKSTTSVGFDIATSLKGARSSDRSLKNVLNKNYYVGLGKDILKNSLEDLKSGKIYNKDRTQQLFDSMDDDFDMGDMNFDTEDFDSNIDDFSDSIDSADGSTHASFSRKKGGNLENTNISVITDLGPDSTIVKATEFQTETTVNVGKAVVENTKVQNRAMMTIVGGMRTEINASLTSIGDNVSQLTSVVSETLSQHNTLSSKYYEDSISLQQQILDAIKNQSPSTSTSFNIKQFKEYNNVMDLIGSGGGVDLKAYIKHVKKQSGNFVDNNMLLSQLKFMDSNKEAFQMTAASPLQKMLTSTIQNVIPTAMQNAMVAFDKQLKETGIATLNQISGLQRSNNPIFNAIGQIFGVQNKIGISKIDKSAYNKGAMSWTGIDHQALTNVIPTLLRKIYASISGTAEIVFDYENGVFRDLGELEKEQIQDRKRRETSGFSDYKSGFKEFMDENFAMSREDKAKYSNDFEKFISRLVKDSAGGRTFRLGGRGGRQLDEEGRPLDDIRALLNASSSDDTNVKLIRSYLQTLEKTDKSALTRLFGSAVQEQRAAIDRQMREIQMDPIKYNTMYMDTGLTKDQKTNAHLLYDKNDKDKVIGVKSGVMAGTIDKYGKNSNYYLREILSTLATGIYVVPISSLSDSSSNEESNSISDKISNRRKETLGKLASDTKPKNQHRENTTVTSSYTDEKKQKDLDNGLIDLDSDLSQDQLTTAVLGRANENNTSQNEEDRSFIGKILSKIPEDSGVGRILSRIKDARNKAGDKGARLFETLNNALFSVVFGDEDGRRGMASIFNRAMNTLKAGFRSFATFLDNKIFKPLDDALFGDDGVINKIKESDFGKKISEVFNNVKDKIGTFLLGEKDSEGNRYGGLFSETANSMKDIGTHVKEGILGKKGPDGNPLPLEEDNSVLGNLKKIFKKTSDTIGKSLGIEKSNESFGTKLANGLDSAAERLKQRVGEWADGLFGGEDSGDETTKILNSEFINQFKEDMKGQKGYIGATASIGALASFFLPGGPIGGALVGAGIGVITKSKGLQDKLFGPEDGNGERVGGLITKEMQNFFKDHKLGMKVGAGLGLGASIGILPSFFLPGGPIGGALIGTGVSLIAKSGAFNDLLYGPGGTKEDPTGGLTKKIKEIFGKTKDTKTLGVDAGIGAGVGILGSFFLPGGPIIGAMIGSAVSIGTATNKFRDWFFGEEDGNGKRQGGVLGKFKNKMQDFFLGEKDDNGKRKNGLLTKLTDTAKLAQAKLGRFIETQMVIPFTTAMEPLTAEAKKIANKVKEKVTDVFDSVKNKIHEIVIKPAGDALRKHFIDPMKRFFTKLFSGFGTLVGSIIAAPFKMLSGVSEGVYNKHKKQGRQHYIDTVNTQLNPFKRENQILPEKGPFKRLRAFGGAIGTWAASRFDKNALESSQYNDQGAYYDRNNEIKWDERRRLKIEAANAKWDAKEASIKNGTDESKLKSDEIYKKRAAERLAEEREKSPWEVLAGRGHTVVNKLKGRKPTNSPTGSSLDLLRNLQNEDDTKVSNNSDDEENPWEYQLNNSNIIKGKLDNTSDNDNKSVVNNKTTRVNVNPSVSGPSKEERKRYKNAYKEAVSAGFSGQDLRDYVLDANGKYQTKVSTPSKDNSTKPSNKLSPDNDNSTKPSNKLSPDNDNKSSDNNLSSSSGKAKGKKQKETKLKDPNKLLSNIDKNVSKISDSTYGQLNGVGSNVNKIYRLLLKTFGKKDEDIKGDNNKEYVGLFGRIRTALNDPIKTIGGIITAPFRKIGEVVTGVVTKVKDLGSKFIGGLTKFGKSIVEGIGGVAKQVALLPIEIIKTGLSVVEATIPVIGETLKTAVSAVGTTIKVAGSVLVNGINAIGNTIVNAAAGFGSLIGDTFKGLGTLIGGAMGGFGQLLSGLGLVGKEVIQDVWKGLKFVGGGVGAVVTAPFKAFSWIKDRLSGKDGKGGLFGKGPIHVIVDSGTLTRVKRVELVEKVQGIQSESSTEVETPVVPKNKAPLLRTNLNMFSHNLEDDTSASPTGSSLDLLRNLQNEDDTSVDTSADTDKIKSSWGSVKDSASKIGNTVRDKLRRKDEAERTSQVERGSRASVEDRIAKEDKDKEDANFKTKLLSLVGRNTEASEKHSSGFLDVFGLKKGIITAGLIMIAPLIIKFLKKFDIVGLASSIISGLGQGFEEIGGLIGLINNTKEKKEDIEDTLSGKDTHIKIEDGNLVYDEKGNLVTEQTDSTHLTEFLTPTRPRINVETGEWENKKEWTQSSGAKFNFLRNRGKKFIKRGMKIVKAGKTAVKAGKTAVKAGKSVVKAGKKAGKKVFDFATKHSDTLSAAYIHADDAIKAGKSAIKNKAATSFEKAKGTIKAGVKKNKTLEKAIGFMNKAIDFLVTKLNAVGEKFGCSKVISALKKVITPVRNILKSGKLAKFSDKIGKFLVKVTGKQTVAAATLFIADIGFALYGAIEGATNAGALFEVRKKDVDAKMRAIAAAFKTLLSTSIGSWVELVNSLVYEILGYNFIKTVATHVYKLLSDDADVEKIKQAQKDFDDDYNAYVDSEYEKHVENEKAAGREPMSKEAFKASSLNTTRMEYNSKVNQSLAAKVINGAKNVGKKVANGAKTVVNGAKKVGKTVVDTGKKAVNGVRNFGNKVINGAKDVFTNGMSSNVVKNVGNTVINGAKDVVTNGLTINGVKNAGNKVINGAKDVVSNGITSAKNAYTGVKNFISNLGKGGKGGSDNNNNFNSKMFTGGKELLSNMIIGRTTRLVKRIVTNTDDVVHGVSQATRNNTTIGKAIRFMNKALNALVDKLIHVASLFGVSINENSLGVKAVRKLLSGENLRGVQQKIIDFTNKIAKRQTAVLSTLGLMEVGFIVYGAIDGATNPASLFEVPSDSVDSLMRAISSAFGAILGTEIGQWIDLINSIVYELQGTNFVKDIATNAYNTIAKLFKPKDVKKLQKAQAKFTSNYNKYKEENNSDISRSEYNNQTNKSFLQRLVSRFTGKGGYTKVASSRPLIGGKGGSDNNGTPYFSQNDPRYKNMQYKQTGDSASNSDTMGESGCGPTAMAMAASKVTGKTYDPVTMAKLAETGGYNTKYGTTPAYFNAASKSLGIASNEMSIDPQSIQSTLSGNSSIILQGQKTGENNSPYTSEGHYVTVTGINGDMVSINDPRGKEYSGEYSLSEVLKDTTGAWSINNTKDNKPLPGGFGEHSKFKNKFKPIKGGKGGNKFTAQDVIKIALGEVGYSEKASVSNLDDKSKNSGSKNFTKYARDIGHTNGLAWCATFVCWVFTKAANNDKKHAKKVLCNAYTAGCANNQSAFKSAKRFDKNPRIGDVVFFMNGSSHTGIVIAINGNKITTVEGNTSPGKFNRDGGCVAKKTYTLPYGRISGFGHPAYDGESNFNGEVGSRASDGDNTGTNTDTNTGTDGFTSISEVLSGAADVVSASIMNNLGIKTSGESSSTDGSNSNNNNEQSGPVEKIKVKGSNNAQKIWNYFTSKGYSKAATAAILGNAQQESGVNPANDAKVAKGLFMWESGRLKNLENYAAKMGKKWSDLEPQMGYLSTELPDPKYAYWNKTATYGSNVKHGAAGKTNFQVAGTSPTTFDKWKNSTDVDTATRQFEAAIERASWPRMDKRVRYAKEFYKKYTGGKGGSDIAPINKSIDKTPIKPINGGMGKRNKAVSSGTVSLRSSDSNIDRIIENNNVIDSMTSKETSQLLKTMINYLSKIVDNTGSTSDGIDELKKKDFGTTNNIISSNSIPKSESNKPQSKTRKSVADRSEYGMAKRIAAGMLD